MYCDKCGAKISDDSVFCDVCGEEVTPTPEGSDRGGSKQGGSKQTSGRGKTSIKESPSAASKAAKIIPIVAVVVIIGLLAGLRQNSRNKAAKEANDGTASTEDSQNPVVEDYQGTADTGAGNIGATDGNNESDYPGAEGEADSSDRAVMTPADLSDDIRNAMKEKGMEEISGYVEECNYDLREKGISGSDPEFVGLCVMDSKEEDFNKVVLVYKVDWKAEGTELFYDGMFFEPCPVYYPIVFESKDDYSQYRTEWPEALPLSSGMASVASIRGFRTLTGLYTDKVRKDVNFVANPDSDLRQLLPGMPDTDERREISHPMKPEDLTADLRECMMREADKILVDYVTRFNSVDDNKAIGSTPEYLGLFVLGNNDGNYSDVILVYKVEWEATEDDIYVGDDLFTSGTVCYPITFRNVCMYEDGVEDYDWDRTDKESDLPLDAISLRSANWINKGRIRGFKEFYGYYMERIKNNDNATPVFEDALKTELEESKVRVMGN